MQTHKNIALCIALNEAIKDERKTATVDYQDILRDLFVVGQLSSGREYELKNIIKQEKDHEKKFTRIATELGCKIE